MSSEIFQAQLLGGGSDDGTPKGSKFFDATTVNELIVKPVIEQSVAMQVSTVLRPTAGARVEIPLILNDGDGEPGWVPAGGEVPLNAAPDAGFLLLDHHKLAARGEVPWEHMDDVAHDVTNIYGQGLVNKLIRTIDDAFFSPAGKHPIHGVGKLKGINEMTATGLANTDTFLDALEHAENHDTKVTSFVMSPATKTAIAKLKKATGSEENLLGVNDAPGSNTISGVPLLSTRRVPDNIIWALPADRLVVSMRQNATLTLDRTAGFERMTAGLLASTRVGMGCIEPAAVTKITIDAAA
ncbi:phage major capsid protein [Corynebacterium halotolerans]|uniref:phage major capsid protein n=1 Tax=Corynebacterium halotolerans TaxID=225326 RepID=UPI003CF6D990